MPTKMIISCLLDVKKIWNSAQINLSSTRNFNQKYSFEATISTEKSTQWNRRRFGAKWNVTVSNSVTPVKPIACKWIYISPGSVVKWHTNYTYIKFSSAVSWNWFWAIFIKFMPKNAVFCCLAQQELNASYETSIFQSMFILPKYW